MTACNKFRLAALLATTLIAACSTPKRPTDAAPGSPAAAPGAQASAPKPPDKGDPQQRFTAALELLKANDFAAAEEALSALIADFPQFSGPHANLGILLARSNRRSEAFAAFARAAQANPRNATAHNWLGVLYSESRDYVRARAAYERALDLRPDFALAHLNLAVLLDDKLGQSRAALPHYRRYQQLAGKDDLRVLAWVAEIEATLKDAEKSP